MSDTAFYCVADERYFLGAVGLVNSLRLVGHDQPIHLLDCGLTKAQRDLLGAQVELVEAPREAPAWLLKTVAPLGRPAARMVLLDVDLVAVRSLDPLIARAAADELLAFRNPVDRFVAEWGQLLGRGAARRSPYLSTAAIVTGHDRGLAVLGLMDELQGLVDFDHTHWRRATAGYAFTYGDQDVFNAIVATMSDAERKRIVALQSTLAPTPPFAGLRLLDEATLDCAYDDATSPYLVHHHTAKPWLEPTHHGIYSRLLRRLLLGDDVAVRVPEKMLPVRFRSGVRALAERKRVNARERWRWHVAEPWGRRRSRR